MRHGLTTIDLFAGAGGLTEGFRQAGFRTLFANDHEEPAIDTFKRNHPEAQCLAAEVESIDAQQLMGDLGLAPGDLDVLVGGPPCQGFSTYGQRKEDDHRNQLYMHFIRFLNVFRPKAYVIENVTGMLSMSGGAVVADILEQLTKCGYGSSVWTLDATEFGVPQRRKRVFIVGLADGAKVEPPRATHRSKPKVEQVLNLGIDLQNPVTVKDAIADLPARTLRPRETHKVIEYPAPPTTEYQREMRGSETQLTHHSSKQMLGIRRLRLALMHPGDWGTKFEERLATNGLPDDLIDRLLGGEEDGLRDINECRTEDRVKELALREKLRAGHTTIDEIMAFMDSQGFANKYRRLRWEDVSHTLVAHMARDCSDFVHPTVDRFISVREAARLQSFPDAYYFEGSQFMQLRHIGNAVPPKLGRAVAEAVQRALMAGAPRETAQTHLHRLQTAAR